MKTKSKSTKRRAVQKVRARAKGLDQSLTDLVNAQLVRPAPEEDLAYLFKHALTQETAYESLLVKKRR